MSITARAGSTAAVRSTDASSLRTPSRSRWPYEIGYACLVALAVLLILSIVGRVAGWPLGTQFYDELLLVRLYAAHFRHLDFFPVWSSSDGLGLGTPILLYYQKAFFYVAAPIFILLGGALKPTLVVTIGIFLAVGAYGMRLALSLLTDSQWLITVGSIGFLFTNYVFTDWLARGDLPEFAALMIVPWLLFWCLNLVRNRKVSLLLIVIVPLLVDAHSAIALISLFAVVVAVITFLWTAGLAGLRAVSARLAITVLGAAILLAPTLLAELRFSNAFDPASKVTHFGVVSQDFVSFGRYFVTPYRWLDNEPSLDLQIDFAIWIPIALGILALGVYWALTRRESRRLQLARYVHTPSLVFLSVSAAVYLFLQLRIFLFVYDVLAPLNVIDYPYRMLAFIIPIGVILVVTIAHVCLRAFGHRAITLGLSVVWLIALVVMSPVTSKWTYRYPVLAPAGQLPSENLGTPPQFIDYTTFKGLLTLDGTLFDEYLPRVIVNGHELYDDNQLYTAIHNRDHGAAALSGARCQILPPTHSPLESLKLAFVVTCDRTTDVALPVTYSSFATVYARSPDGHLTKVPYIHVPSDPRIVVRVPGSRPETLVVHLPTLWGVLK